MKLTALFLLIGSLQLSAGIPGKRLSISVKNYPLGKIFVEIEKKTNYVFFYDATLLQHTRPVTVRMKNATVEEVLQASLRGQALEFLIQDRTIFVKREVSKTSRDYSTTNRLSTGNVTTEKAQDIQKQPAADPVIALEGRVPGLYIQQTSGIPGAYSSPFNYLNPADIESIEALKDADATAIYGSEDADGVILITTKQGNLGHTQFDVSEYSGVAKVTRTVRLLNTQQYLAMRQ